MLNTKPIIAVGAMSGTSLDGIDVAQITTDGIEILEFGPSSYKAYTASEQHALESALGLWPNETPESVKELIETLHATALSPYEKADLIGFHGQTLAHDPNNSRTYQCGDGEVLAHALNKTVVWDFRSSDMALGGQGAPLAPFYHFALAKWLKETTPVAFLNLGGVGNLTWVDPSCDAPEQTGALLAFDTGPANAPMNDLMKLRAQKPYDKNGDIAAQGIVHQHIVDSFMSHLYFSIIPPKSLDRNTFDKQLSHIQALSLEDALATLCAISAAAVGQAMRHLPSAPQKIYLCGGGRHNATLIEHIKAHVQCPLICIDDLGLDGDMLEAQAFAYLAVRVLYGMPTSCKSTTGVQAAVSGGIISRSQSSIV